MQHTSQSQTKNPSSNTKRKAFLDGSNLMLNVLDRGQPSVAFFANVVHALEQFNFAVESIFDPSIKHNLEQRGAGAQWQILQRLAKKSEGQISFHVFPDAHFLGMVNSCLSENPIVVNHNDRYGELSGQFSEGFPEIVKVQCADDFMSLVFERSSHPSIKGSVNRDLILYGVSLSDGA